VKLRWPVETTSFSSSRARANFNAPFHRFGAELQKKQHPNARGVRFVIASASNPLSSEQSSATCWADRDGARRESLFHDRMVPTDIKTL